VKFVESSVSRPYAFIAMSPEHVQCLEARIEQEKTVKRPNVIAKRPVVVLNKDLTTLVECVPESDEIVEFTWAL